METIITVLGYLSLLALLFFALMQALARFLTLEKSKWGCCHACVNTCPNIDNKTINTYP